MIRYSVDPHLVLDEAFDVCRLNGAKVLLVKSRLARLRADSKWVRVGIVLMATIALQFGIFLSLLKSRPIIVREYWNIPLLLFSPLLFPFRRHIIFNVNHNITDAQVNSISTMKILCWMGFRFLLLDGFKAVNSFPKTMQKAFLTPFFPISFVNSMLQKRQIKRGRLVVSVVGELRSEKGGIDEISALLGKLIDMRRWEIRLGVRAIGVNPLNHIKGLKFFNTESRGQYMQFLSDSDFVLIFANKAQYFYRHSGTIMDAIACGAIPLVPNFPVLASQVLEPFPVGAVYDSLMNIPDDLIKLEMSSAFLVANQKKYTYKRSNIEILA